jgi:putative DNA primase/helicase
VDLRENTLVPKAGPDLLVTKSTGDFKFVAIEGRATPSSRAAPRRAGVHDRPVGEWMSDDESMIAFLLLWFGASLFGFTPEQRFLLMTGIGRNGKGALKHSILRAVGEYGAQSDANLYMRSKFGAARSDQARADLIAIKGKRVTFFSEPEGGRFNEELLKAHTGGDRITARALHSNNVQSWDPTHSITFLTNEAPEVDDLGPSMAARVMVADFRERYDGDKEDKLLYGKLEREAAGILSILCWAARAWYTDWSAGKGGITLPPRVVEQSRAFMERNDPVANWLNARAAFERGSTCPSQLAYESFAEWAKAEGGEVPFSQVRFALELGKKGFLKRKVTSGMVWSGFRLLGAMALAERELPTEGEGDDEADDEA